MHTNAENTRENKSQSVAASVSQKQSPGTPVFQIVDNRPEAIAQRRQQAMANDSPHVKQLKAYQELANNHSAAQNQPVQKQPAGTRDGAGSGEPVQRVERDAQVTWATTHLVQVQEGESLFGQDWQSGELPPDLGQLSEGQLIKVDDEAVFMSRRGPNQEEPSRRMEDEETGELRYKWFKVLAVGSDDGFNQVPDDTYVRAETIKLIGVEKLPSRKMDVTPQTEEDIIVGDLDSIHQAWLQAALKRRRSIAQVNFDFSGKMTEEHDELTSGRNWDRFDEGVDVSGNMKDPTKRVPVGSEQYILRASYNDEPGEPIAYMILEVRDDDDGGGPYMWLRWLIGHPTKGGGGSRLVQDAKDRLNGQDRCTELRVASALSAVGFYQDRGFEKVYPDKNHVVKGVGSADTELVYRKGT